MRRPLAARLLLIFFPLLFSACATVAPAETAAAAAAEPSDADIERLLAASRAQSMLDAIAPQIDAMQREQFEQLTAGKNLTDAQKAEVEQIQTRTNEIVRKALAWEEMKPLYVDVYKKTFTREDIRDITRFYESRAGQNLLDRSPALMQNLMLAVQQKVVPMLDELKTELQNVSDESEAMPAPPVSPPQQRRAVPRKAAPRKATPRKAAPRKPAAAATKKKH